MKNPPIGPGSPFQLLFNDLPAGEPSLPDAFRTIYPGDWQIPEINGRPYIYTDFAISRDGRITYHEEGYVGGSDVTQTNIHDWWFMAFLRTRADAIMNGAGTAPLDSGHLWTAEDLYPEDAAAFAELRQAEGRTKPPIVVILTHDGRIDFQGPSLDLPDMHIVVATTPEGAAYAADFDCVATVDVHVLGEKTADLQKTVDMLYSDYAVRNLLSEGGSTVQAGLLDAGLIDEEFVTWCPSFVGRNNEKFRPSYTEGVAWHPTTAPYSKPISLHRAGDLLYMRTRCQYQK
ncbi:MAG: dihydrofolate reductase family protein [Chloroflexota bacterium]